MLRTTGYAWDNADQITSQTVNGVTTSYGYDLAGQLTSEVRTGYNVAYTYDANGNRTSKTVNGAVESYTYDLADKMLTAGAKSYTYDAAGRTVGINAPGGTTTLTYDYESRVTAISGPGINETHTYNGLDTRVGTVQGGVSRTFVRDGSYVTDPVLRDGQATYTPGVSERRGGVSTWSHSGLKNADAQTSSVGAIAATRVYDAFGAELSATGTWKGPFGYAGGFGYQEDSSGLKLLGHRYYDPTTGRFLSRDPIKDGRNWFVYCGNDPIGNFDSVGLAPTRLIAKEAMWFTTERVLRNGSKGQPLPDTKLLPVGAHTQLGWRTHAAGNYPYAFPHARTLVPRPGNQWAVEKYFDFTNHGRPDHPLVHAHEYGPAGRGPAVKVPGKWTPVPAPTKPPGPLGGGGSRGPGSGGGLGALGTVAQGLDAFVQGAPHFIKWRASIDMSLAGATYAADGESEAQTEAYKQMVGAVDE